MPWERKRSGSPLTIEDEDENNLSENSHELWNSFLSTSSNYNNSHLSHSRICARNGMTWICDGTRPSMEVSKICEFRRTEYGSPMCWCITGESLQHILVSQLVFKIREIPTFSQNLKCWWGFRRNLSDECRRAEQWILLIRATWNIQVNM